MLALLFHMVVETPAARYEAGDILRTMYGGIPMQICDVQKEKFLFFLASVEINYQWDVSKGT